MLTDICYYTLHVTPFLGPLILVWPISFWLAIRIELDSIVWTHILRISWTKMHSYSIPPTALLSLRLFVSSILSVCWFPINFSDKSTFPIWSFCLFMMWLFIGTFIMSLWTATAYQFQLPSSKNGVLHSSGMYLSLRETEKEREINRTIEIDTRC